MPVFRHHDVVFDAHTAERRELVDEAPVEMARRLALTERTQQHLDEIEARLDGEHVTGFDSPGIAQVRVFLGRRRHTSARVREMSADVVHLKAKVMTEAVRKERPAEPPGDRFLGLDVENLQSFQECRYLQMCLVVKLAVREAWFDGATKLFL